MGFLLVAMVCQVFLVVATIFQVIVRCLLWLQYLWCIRWLLGVLLAVAMVFQMDAIALLVHVTASGCPKI